MAQPLKVNAQNNLQEMGASDTDYMVYRIGNSFALTDTGTGSVQVNPADTTGLTLIGTFTDTTRQDAVGSHPVGTSVNSTTYNFYQDRRTHTEPSLEIPLEYNTGTGNIEQQSDATINASWIDTTRDTIVAMGSNAVGCYVLQPTAPVGGTWTAKGTITNSLVDGTTNNTYLWRKTDAAFSSTIVRPVKYSSGNIQEMTDAEIGAWQNRLRNHLKDDVGQYALSTSAPTSGGTWAAAGTAFYDTRKELGMVSYSGGYSGTRSYSGTRTYSGTYVSSGSFAADYAGFAGTAYSGTRSYSGSRVHGGTFTGSGTFTGNYSGQTVLASDENVSNMTLWVRTA